MQKRYHPPPPVPMPRGAALQAQAKGMPNRGRHVPPPPLAPIKPNGAIQRMEEPPDPWRHLNTSHQSLDQRYQGNWLPLLQIEVGRHVVRVLRQRNIMARLGGSTASLGYLTTRTPDDVDIDILPHTQDDFAIAVDIVRQQARRSIKFVSGGSTWHFTFRSIIIVKTTTVVCEFKVDGTAMNENTPYDPSNYGLDVGGDPCSIKLQIVDESAFTHLTVTRDPGFLGEKYKEVAGFSRLVANCLGRLIQDQGSNAKKDRARITEMLTAKISTCNLSKIQSICRKILSYFYSPDEYKNLHKDDLDIRERFYSHEIAARQEAARILSEIVTQIRPEFDQTILQLMISLPGNIFL